MLKAAIPYSLTTILFKFPYHAFEYAYEGIEIGGVLLFSALNALLAVIVFYIEAIALFFLLSLVADKTAKRCETGKSEIFKSAKPFDLDAPLNTGILAVAGAMFVYKLISELIDTVKYFITYIDSYRASEIAYITFRYVYLLLLAITAHLVISTVKNRILTPKENNEEAE